MTTAAPSLAVRTILLFVGGGALEERVFDDAVFGVHDAQFLAQIGQLGHGQAAVVGQDGSFSFPDQFFQLGDDFDFGVCGFCDIVSCDDIHLLFLV